MKRRIWHNKNFIIYKKNKTRSEKLASLKKESNSDTLEFDLEKYNETVNFKGRRYLIYPPAYSQEIKDLKKCNFQPYFWWKLYEFTFDKYNKEDFGPAYIKNFILFEPIFWIKHGIYPEWIKWLFCTILGGIIGGLITYLFAFFIN